MVQIAAMLDRARVLNDLPSDYKLALVMGVDWKSLNNYRQIKTLPNVRVIGKLCELTGDDPHLLTAQVEFQRAKDDETRTIWAGIAARLSAPAIAHGFAQLGMMVCLVLMAGLLALSQATAGAASRGYSTVNPHGLTVFAQNKVSGGNGGIRTLDGAQHPILP